MSGSREYWREREDAALKAYIKDEKEYDKEVKKIYQNQLNAIQTEINAFYGKYAKAEGITISEAKKRVSQHDVKAFESKAAKYVKDRDFSAKANEELRLYNATMKINRLEMLKANIGLEMIAGHDDLEKFMGGILKGRTEDELKRQAGILGKTIVNNAKLVDSVVNASFKNATFSDRIWMHQDLLKNKLSSLLQSGMIQGKNPRVLARELQNAFNTSTYDAERLMRTELARVQTEAQKQSFKRNGFTLYEFIANSGCCDICQSKDGKHFEVEKMMPGENAAPMHPNCRCSVAPWEDSDEYEAWLDYLDKGGTTEKWNEMRNAGNVAQYRKKGYTHRRTADGGTKIIDKPTYNKITKPAIKAGADIRIAEGDWLRRLEDKDSTAATIGDVIIFRPDATVSDVLEEVYHFYQNKRGLNDKYNVKQREIMNEIDVKEYLLTMVEKYNIPEEETNLTKKQLEDYIKDREAMKERGEWDD